MTNTYKGDISLLHCACGHCVDHYVITYILFGV